VFLSPSCYPELDSGFLGETILLLEKFTFSKFPSIPLKQGKEAKKASSENSNEFSLDAFLRGKWKNIFNDSETSPSMTKPFVLLLKLETFCFLSPEGFVLLSFIREQKIHSRKMKIVKKNTKKLPKEEVFLANMKDWVFHWEAGDLLSWKLYILTWVHQVK